MLLQKLDKARLTDEEKEKFRQVLDCSDTVDYDWTWGYLCALIDLEKIFMDNFFDSLCKEFHITRNAKTIHALMKFFLKHRDYLRFGKLDKGFIGYDEKKKEFYYAETKKILVRID